MNRTGVIIDVAHSGQKIRFQRAAQASQNQSSPAIPVPGR